METASLVSRFTSFMMSFLNDGMEIFFTKVGNGK
jgi:hypothetical protein